MKNISYLYISIAIIAWGLSFIWMDSLISNDIPVLVFMTGRLIIASVVLWTVALATKKFNRLDKKDIIWFLLLGLFQPYFYFLGETFGLKATESPTLSSLVIATFPIFSIIVGQIFFKEKLKRLNILGILITLPGVFLMAYTEDGFTAKYLWGIALLFGAVFSSLCDASIVKKLAARYNAITITTIQFTVGAMLFLPTMLIVDGKSLGQLDLIATDVIVPIVLLGLFCSALAFLLYNQSLKDLGLARTATFTALIPVVTAVASALFGHESFTIGQVAGILVVVAGVILTQK